MAKTKAEKTIDREIERLYKLHAQGKQIDIMDIGKLYADAKAVLLAGGSLEDGVKAGIVKYCMVAS